MIPETRLTDMGQAMNGAVSMTLGLLPTQPFFTWKTFTMALGKRPSLSQFPRLWAGYIPNAASGAPAEAIAFAVHQFGRTHLLTKNEDGSLTDSSNLALSLAAGTFGAPINACLEQGMIREQLEGGSFHRHLQVIYREQGFKGLFKATAVTAGRDGWFNCGIFFFYDVSRRIVTPWIKDPFSRDVVAGMLAGMPAGFISTPYDLCKTLMQSDKENKYPTFRATCKKILNEAAAQEYGKKNWDQKSVVITKAGIQALFRGCIPRSFTIGGLVCATAFCKERVPSYFPSYLKSQEPLKPKVKEEAYKKTSQYHEESRIWRKV